MSEEREGGCACGALRYRLQSEPMIVHCCHCLDCQAQTGSAFVVNLLIETDRVDVLAGTPILTEAPRDDGSPQRIFRCPECLVAVFSQYGSPKLRYVRAGTLDVSRTIVPDVHIFIRSKVEWVTVPDNAPAFPAFYDDHATVWSATALARLQAIRQTAS